MKLKSLRKKAQDGPYLAHINSPCRCISQCSQDVAINDCVLRCGGDPWGSGGLQSSVQQLSVYDRKQSQRQGLRYNIGFS